MGGKWERSRLSTGVHGPLRAKCCRDKWIKLQQNEDLGLQRNRGINSFNFPPAFIHNDVGKYENEE